MNPEKFIVDQVISNIDGAADQIKLIVDETIERYRKSIYDTLPNLIQEMRGKLSLIQGTTVSEYMKASGMSEYRARKHLNSLAEDMKTSVDMDKRPYVYKI